MPREIPATSRVRYVCQTCGTKLAVVSTADQRILYRSAQDFSPAPDASVDAAVDLFQVRTQDFAPLARPGARWCRAVMLIGRDAPAIRAALADTGAVLTEHPTLEAATLEASAIAQPGDAVLLSPACASFDMFKDYSHRADVFRGAVQDIAAQRGTML